jgi:hypothetical protein
MTSDVFAAAMVTIGGMMLQHTQNSILALASEVLYLGTRGAAVMLTAV